MGSSKDRLAVIELIHRYAALIDFKRYDEADRVFSKNAVANYESMRAYVGDDFEPKGPQAIGEWLRKYTGTRASMHYMHNHVVELDGKRASMRNYMHNINSSIGGVYHTEAKKTKAGWRITRLRLEERYIDTNLLQNPHVPEMRAKAPEAKAKVSKAKAPAARARASKPKATVPDPIAEAPEATALAPEATPDVAEATTEITQPTAE